MLGLTKNFFLGNSRFEMHKKSPGLMIYRALIRHVAYDEYHKRQKSIGTMDFRVYYSIRLNLSMHVRTTINYLV